MLQTEAKFTLVNYNLYSLLRLERDKWSSLYVSDGERKVYMVDTRISESVNEEKRLNGNVEIGSTIAGTAQAKHFERQLEQVSKALLL
jgi:hypothetical protein